MRSIKIYLTGTAVLLAGMVVTSCTKSFSEKTTQQKDFNNSTLAQVFIATVGATRNYVYMDGKPVTGALLSSGSVFPSTGYAFNIPAGVRSFTIKDTLKTSTQVPLTFSENLDVAKQYTIFAYGSTTAPLQVTVPTEIVTPADNFTSRIRFGHFAYSPGALPNVDIYSTAMQSNIFTDIQVAGVTEFISYPALTTDTLSIREAGTSNELFRHILSGGVTPKRSYTLVFRGDYASGRASTLFGN